MRQWLPELARMPAKWIHHPWNAPLIVLQSAGVELGLNYPMPIVDIDQARDSLTNAIFTMWERESSARAAQTNEITDEEVNDNTENFELPIPTVVLNPNAAGSTASSRDQRVPSFQQAKTKPNNRKRSKSIYIDEPVNRSEAGPSKEDEEDSWSTAESSYKKQTTTSSSFSVSHSWMSPSEGKMLRECEDSDAMKASEEENGKDQCSSKMGE